MAKDLVTRVLDLVVRFVIIGAIVPYVLLVVAVGVLYVPIILRLLGFGSEAAYDRAVQEERAGNLDGALKWYTKAIGLNPRRAEYYFLRGSVYERLGDYRRAVDDYTVGMVLSDRSSFRLVARGRAYERLGDLYNAASDYCEAILSHFISDLGLKDLAEDFRPGCSWSEALQEWIKFFEKAVAEHPENQCFKKALDFLRDAEIRLKTPPRISDDNGS